MEAKPYFCPNCRANRIKFNLITSTSLQMLKDAYNGQVVEQADPMMIAESEPMIQCRVCNYSGNEMRFIRQAEREPRIENTIKSTN
ncbi:hypothetical protein [Chengkuizengella axinellae]|uniref:DNA alkylation repair protein n=1 Tax=Chengkuizengella axinellae TaxID=3064388 RepID=A0ABT9IVP5_9BACL|nr:hypothetical protein [Chengkuizengella sp. 2205SS18-9]MDP5273425.1 hypothetical protein [Chengkuizengella sp. 2205SS18-9]